MSEEEKEITMSGRQLAQMVEIEKQSAQALANQAMQLRAIIDEIRAGIQALKSIEGKKQQQILVPLGAGAWIEAKIESAEKAKISLPGSIVGEKTIKEAVEFLEKQLEAARKQQEQTNNSLAQSNARIQELSAVIGLAKQNFSKQARKDNK